MVWKAMYNKNHVPVNNISYFNITNSVSFCSEIEVVELIETNFFF